MKLQAKSVLAIGVLAFTAAAASAQERPRVNLNQPQSQQTQTTPGIAYTYAGARYINQSIDSSFECDQDGINLYGSLDIRDGFYARASFSDVSGDSGCGSTSFSAGAGYHTAYSNDVDMYASLSFVSVSEGDNDTGLELAAGLRSFLAEQIEGGLELYHGTYGLEETGIRGSLFYWLNESVSLSGDLGVGSDSTTFGFGARMVF